MEALIFHRLKNKTKIRIFIIFEIISSAFFSVFLSAFVRWWISLTVFLLVNMISIILFRLIGNKSSFLNLCIKDLINGLVLSITFAFSFTGLITGNMNLSGASLWKYGLLFSIFFVSILPTAIFNSVIRIKKTEKGTGTRLNLSFSILIIYLLFFCVFDLSIELQLNNYLEFSFSFMDVVNSLLPYGIIAVAVLAFSSILPHFSLTIFDSILTWLALCFYVQCMFFNRYLGRITGAKYVWENHPLYSVIDAFVWFGLLVIVIVVSIKYKENKDKIWIFIKTFLLALAVVSLIFTIIRAPKEAFCRRQLYLSGDEQFTVGSEKNVILLIADAVDNSFVKELLDNNPDVYDAFNDFTLYTDTCSVYDLTDTSIQQMLYGYTQKEGTDKSIPFLKRFGDNGYRILFYGVFARKAGTEGYIDNCISADDMEEISSISYNLISSNFILLSIYKVAPCFLKPLIPINTIDFNNCLVYKKNKLDIISENNEFENKLILQINEKSKNCLIYQHIDGAHLPCDNYVEETKHCLRIFGEYINQLKQLGVYDDSVIIIASDHGMHDDVDGIPYGTAATPMFIVKKSGEQHESIQISEKPIYYMDFQATIIRYAGLFDESIDYELFGKSIDDYTDEMRTRVWFDEAFESDTCRKYKYTGNTKELERVVDSGEYEEVDSLEFDYSELEK